MTGVHDERGRLLLQTPDPIRLGLAYVLRVESKIEKVPRGIRGEKSSKDMASSRNLVSTIIALASPKMRPILFPNLSLFFPTMLFEYPSVLSRFCFAFEFSVCIGPAIWGCVIKACT